VPIEGDGTEYETNERKGRVEFIWRGSHCGSRMQRRERDVNKDYGEPEGIEAIAICQRMGQGQSDIRRTRRRECDIPSWSTEVGVPLYLQSTLLFRNHALHDSASQNALRRLLGGRLGIPQLGNVVFFLGIVYIRSPVNTVQ
jgi:hypothetical protein